jgi:hypothetical protein
LLSQASSTVNDTARTFGDVEGFINMLLAACQDDAMNETLQILLSQPDERRRVIVLRLLDRLRERQAPQALIEAMACLLDDDAAEKAYAAIHQCARKGNT